MKKQVEKLRGPMNMKTVFLTLAKNRGDSPRVIHEVICSQRAARLIRVRGWEGPVHSPQL